VLGESRKDILATVESDVPLVEDQKFPNPSEELPRFTPDTLPLNIVSLAA
jgi:hypothetical protein